MPVSCQGLNHPSISDSALPAEIGFPVLYDENQPVFVLSAVFNHFLLTKSCHRNYDTILIRTDNLERYGIKNKTYDFHFFEKILLPDMKSSFSR